MNNNLRKFGPHPVRIVSINCIKTSPPYSSRLTYQLFIGLLAFTTFNLSVLGEFRSCLQIEQLSPAVPFCAPSI